MAQRAVWAAVRRHRWRLCPRPWNQECFEVVAAKSVVSFRDNGAGRRVSSGTHTALSSPARCKRTNVSESQRFVFTGSSRTCFTAEVQRLVTIRQVPHQLGDAIGIGIEFAKVAQLTLAAAFGKRHRIPCLGGVDYYKSELMCSGALTRRIGGFA